MSGSLIKQQCEESRNQYVCPACDSKVKSVHYSYHEDQREFKVFRCENCSFMFARPLFLPKLEDRKLDYEYDMELLNNASLRKAHERFVIGKEIKHVRNILGNGTFSLLDIGCGTGWTTNMWASSGFDTTGLEPSKLRAELASERYKIKVLSDYFENLHIRDNFDVVILRHMIEHFADPYEMMLKARSFLKPRGTAVIIVPNINCLGRYLFGTKWTWGIPYHCNFFTPKTLTHLVERAGFEIITTYQTPSPLLYPESLFRYMPYSKQLSAKYHRGLSLLSMIPFTPLIAMGYMMRLSENITVIARDKGN
jgi:2-polyprenyl-3-methyl-5-hydroxy-6-metoxy-1,4-benzoquinol methylase